MSLRVAGLCFDHARGFAGAYTLPLRLNENFELPLPEWAFFNRNQCAVAYLADRLPPLAYVMARFEATPGEPREIQIRAQSMVSADAVAGMPLLPDIAPALIQFDASMDSNWCALAFDTASLGDAVNLGSCQWIWQFRRVGEIAWTDFDMSNHRVYVVLTTPTAPWQIAAPVSANTSLPWADALEVACTWARGARNPIDVASHITRAVNSLGGQLLTYDKEVGAPHYTMLGAPRFLCTAFLARLRGEFGMGPLVNCSDCATIVSTFANLLGADLWQSKMGLIGRGFSLNPILSIGGTQWSVGWGGFSFHEVAWSGACREADTLFDACLHVDADADPTQAPHSARLPVSDVFGTTGSGDYRDRIAAPVDRDLCVPQPALRIRRPIDARAVSLRSAATLALRFTPVDDALAEPPGVASDEETHHIEGFFLGGQELPGWSLRSTAVSQVAPRPSALKLDMPLELQVANASRVNVTVWSDRANSEAQLRIESIECASAAEARNLLAQILTEIQCPLVMPQENGAGERRYQTPNGSLVLFVRGNHVHVLRSAGTQPVDVGKDAARLDEWLTTAGTPVGGISAAPLMAGTWRRLRIPRVGGLEEYRVAPR